VASLGWVSPVVATEGITPIYFLEKTDDPEGVTSHLFLPVRLRLSTILCKFAHNKFFFVRVSPSGGCHPGRSAPSSSLVTPLTL